MMKLFGRWYLTTEEHYNYFRSKDRINMIPGDVRETIKKGNRILWSITPTLSDDGNYTGECALSGYVVSSKRRSFDKRRIPPTIKPNR